MPSRLNLFPAHVPIGRVIGPDGQPQDVMMTPEFARALSLDLMERLGGTYGMTMSELAGLAGDTPTESAKVAALRQQVDELTLRLVTAGEMAAKVTALSKQVDELNAKLAEVGGPEAKLAALRSQIKDLATMVHGLNPSPPVNLSDLRAGNITYTGKLTGGTGVVALGTNQFYKDTAGNICLGGTDPGSKLDVRGEIRTTVDGFGVYSAGTMLVQLHYNGGPAINRRAGYNFNIRMGGSNQATWDTSGNFTTAAGFGCNGKSAQPAYALGGAASDLPTVIALANNLRAMAVGCGIGS